MLCAVRLDRAQAPTPSSELRTKESLIAYYVFFVPKTHNMKGCIVRPRSKKTHEDLSCVVLSSLRNSTTGQRISHQRDCRHFTYVLPLHRNSSGQLKCSVLPSALQQPISKHLMGCRHSQEHMRKDVRVLLSSSGTRPPQGDRHGTEMLSIAIICAPPVHKTCFKSVTCVVLSCPPMRHNEVQPRTKEYNLPYELCDAAPNAWFIQLIACSVFLAQNPTTKLSTTCKKRLHCQLMFSAVL